jgi:hypothetical protein
MSFHWRSPWSGDWFFFDGTVPEVLAHREEIDLASRLIEPYYWAYCGCKIERLVFRGEAFTEPKLIDAAMGKLTTRGAIASFEEKPQRAKTSTVKRKSFTLSMDSAAYLSQFENQSAEVDRLIRMAKLGKVQL